MRILWHSNAPWANTGYGVQTKYFTKGLKDAGHEVMISSFYGVQGGILSTGDGIKILPNSKDMYGNDILLAHSEFWEPDIIISLIDVWIFDPDLLSRINLHAWLPVDHDPVPPKVGDAAKLCKGAISFSKHGVDALAVEGVTAQHIPLAVDTQVFKPIPQDVARDAVGLPRDVFVAGIVAANKGAPSRKAFDQQIRAFARFQRNHPDAVLYLHTDMVGTNGEDLNRVIELSGLPKSNVAVVPQYQHQLGMYEAEQMVSVYSAMDVLLNATRGEGFGVPIIEAQACGTPVIVTDFTSMSELCYSGWKVGYVDKFYTALGSYQVVPSVDEIAFALEMAFESDGNMRFDAANSVSAYDYRVIIEKYWVPYLAAIEESI